MANIAAIRSVSSSLAAYLNNAYGASTVPSGVTMPNCTFVVASIGGVTTQTIPSTDLSVRVLIFLYRASINQHLRNVGRVADGGTRPVPLSVDLRYLFSFWSNSAENEQLALAWTMRQLHEVPILDSSILSAEAAWAPDDVIQLIPEEISNEDLMRIWDAIDPAYRLSLSYIARVVRIDPAEVVGGRAVVATRFDYAVPAEPR
jgi:Pvc16 N-terminal domain